MSGLASGSMPPRTPVTKCDRCGLYYPIDVYPCSFCGELTDIELVSLKRQIELEHQNNAELGRVFIYLAISVVVVMLYMLL